MLVLIAGRLLKPARDIQITKLYGGYYKQIKMDYMNIGFWPN